MTYPVLDASGAERGRPSLLEDALDLARRTGEGTRVLRARDGALLAIRGRVPRESPRPAGTQPPILPTETKMANEDQGDESEAESTPMTRAIEKAGTVKALAKALGIDASGLYRAQRIGRVSDAVAAQLEEYLGESTDEGDEEEPAVGEDPSSAESRAAWVARKPAPAEEAPQAKPVVTRRAPAPAAPKTVRLELEAPTARELYLLARSTGRAELALVLSDALLAEVA